MSYSKGLNSEEPAVFNAPLKRRIVTSVTAQFMSQIFMGIAGIILLKLLTTKLGIKNYGIYATCFVFVTTFSILTDLGINSITAREIAKAPDKASDIISHNITLRLLLSAIMIPIISGLGFVLYPHYGRALHLGILLASSYLIFDAIGSTSSAYFGSKVRNDIPAVISALQQLLFLVLTLCISFINWGIFGFLGAYVVSTAVGAVAVFWLVRKYIRIKPRIDPREWRKIIGMSISLGIFSVIYNIYIKVDSILISIIKGTVAVGLYGVSYSIVNVFLYFSGYLMLALTPTLATANEEEFDQIIQKAFDVMIVFALLLVVGGYIVRDNVILLVSNKVFVKSAEPFAILTLATVFSYFYSIFSFASVAINKHHKMIYVSLIILGLNVGINLIFVPKFGIVGAAWATVISEFIAMLVAYYIFYKQTGVKLHMGTTIKPLAAAVCSLGLGLLFYNRITTNSALYDCTVAALLVGGSYFTILYAIGGLPEEIKAAIDTGLNMARGYILHKNG